jgi:hypothetical protein
MLSPLAGKTPELIKMIPDRNRECEEDVEASPHHPWAISQSHAEF